MTPNKGQNALRADSCHQFDETTSAAGREQSPKNLVEISKMRKLNDARREWEDRHQSNSPFRIDAYGSSSSIGYDSAEGSPMSVSRGYGFRNAAAKDKLVVQPPLNLTNKQSSFFKKNISSSGKSSNAVNSNNSPMSGAQASTMLS